MQKNQWKDKNLQKVNAKITVTKKVKFNTNVGYLIVQDVEQGLEFWKLFSSDYCCNVFQISYKKSLTQFLLFTLK